MELDIAMTYTGNFLFLRDHFIGGSYIPAGTTMQMFDWSPTGDVDPLDMTAVNSFYNNGPIRTELSVVAPITYWKQTSPNVWGLTGLGSGLAPVSTSLRTYG